MMADHVKANGMRLLTASQLSVVHMLSGFIFLQFDYLITVLTILEISNIDCSLVHIKIYQDKLSNIGKID